MHDDSDVAAVRDALNRYTILDWGGLQCQQALAALDRIEARLAAAEKRYAQLEEETRHARWVAQGHGGERA